MPEPIEAVMARYGFTRDDDGRYIGHRLVVLIDPDGKIGLWTITGRPLGHAFDGSAFARLLDAIL